MAEKRTSVYLTEENKELLRQVAFWQRKSQKDVMNDTLNKYLKEELKKYEKQ